MGQNYSFKNSEIETKYRKVQEKYDEYFGKIQILQDLYTHDQVMHKILHLSSSQEVSEFQNNFKQQNKTAFHVIFPYNVEPDCEEGLCTKSESVHVLFKNKYSNLCMKVQQEISMSSKRMKESQIWFILNELTRSLQILHENKHPHMWILPETVFYNKNENWFLYDTYYIRGVDFQDFVRYKFNKQKLISDSLKYSIQNHHLDLQIIFEEDIYCLGFVILYAMTNFYPHFHLGKLQIQNLMNSCNNFYSKKLIRLVNSMIEESNHRRISLKSLRERLKMQEKNIILEQQFEYKRQTEYHRQRFKTDHKTVKLQNTFSPPLPPLYQEFQTTKKVFYNSPPTQNRSRHFMSPSNERAMRVKQFNFTSPHK